ncbi:MAG: FecCD family ABC transporter permease [Burkholderiaceae bacterium]
MVFDQGAQAQLSEKNRRRSYQLAGLAVALIALLFLDLALGPANIPVADIWKALWHTDSGLSQNAVIVRELRAPQTLMALLVGLALGLAGAEMQTVLDNPLASPFTLGVSSAAALGAAVVLVLQWNPLGLPGSYALALGAFFAGALCTLAIDQVARHARLGTTGIILIGIALVFSFNAMLSLLQLRASSAALQDLIFWMMGSLARAQWSSVALLAPIVIFSLAGSMYDSSRLTSLRFGEERALGLGVHTHAVRRRALLRASLLACVAVALVGVIGFIGLMAPHIARRLWGEDHRWYLPASALAGGLTLLSASVVSKSLAQDAVLPVGIVTTLTGIPFFILALLRRPD